jgi:hypothetical protein
LQYLTSNSNYVFKYYLIPDDMARLTSGVGDNKQGHHVGWHERQVTKPPGGWMTQQTARQVRAQDERGSNYANIMKD